MTLIALKVSSYFSNKLIFSIVSLDSIQILLSIIKLFHVGVYCSIFNEFKKTIKLKIVKQMSRAVFITTDRLNKHLTVSCSRWSHSGRHSIYLNTVLEA